MITKINVQLKLPKEKRTYNLGSVLQGVLMEMLPQKVIVSLHHQSKYSPLKQRVVYKNDDVDWEIVSFNQEISKYILEYFFENHSIHIKKHDLIVNIENYKISKIDIKSLIDKHFEDDNPKKYIKLNIMTPMSFKSNGQYDIFPDIRKFYRSTMLAFDSFFDEYHMYDRETLEYLGQNVSIVDYKLKSTRFHLEGVKIPSFTGEITIRVNGAKTFLQLINLLTEFGSLSGVGIKTSIGMGKYEIING